MTQTEIISPEWQGILQPGERILWQGAPRSDDPSLKTDPYRSLLAIGVIAFATVMMAYRIPEAPTTKALLALFGLWLTACILIGYPAFGRTMFLAYKTRHSFYTLTTLRAFIGWTLFGHRRLEQWPIIRETKVELVPGNPGHVHFAERLHHNKHSTDVEKVGFRNIADPEAVHALILKVQEGTA
ncbi:hypothetical protein [Seohaeicola zhoushanensis]|uniref:Uncharacterized protein n=1 Tax=Seohaeicola zhoushanensis TaxID=1569283 RepID=A0A8J3GUK8_9RHOB|nr:hypothetical protein [Seohaeicola zhoushanensis]GHF37568.1 hypothetical protein GCM10017056_06860 [Seohaeicola zhoushanensis]